MEELIELKIDGKEVEVPAGTNLIDAAGLAGIHIPNLCYLKGTKGVGACRLCLVEIQGLKAPVIACNTRVKEGMVVNTRTERVQEVRKFVIDLLLSMHPLDCMTCTKAGGCNLQQYAYEFGLKESSFTRKRTGYPTDEANPFIKRDPEYCILCGRCVRVCREQGTNVLDFMGRGIESKIVTANDRPLQESECTFCGSCVDACPVNALLESDGSSRGRVWEYEKTKTVCLLCGNGCDISVSTKDGRVLKINSAAEAGSSERYLCAYGRFGFDCFEAGTRLTSPMKRVGGELRETTWAEALDILAGRVKKKGGKTGFISVAGLMNEDAMALKRLALEVVKTKNFDTTLSLYGDSSAFSKSDTADIDRADIIILVDVNPSQWERVMPALDASVRRRVSRGAKLIVINSSEVKIAEAATLNLRGDEIALLKGIVKVLLKDAAVKDKKLEASVEDGEITGDVEKAADLIGRAVEPLIFSSPAFFDASANMALVKGKVISVGFESNSRGVALMGLVSEGKSYKDMVVSGALEVLYAVGEVPLLQRPEGVEFLVVQHSHLTELAKQADIVLPSAGFLESSGTIVDYLGRMKYLRRAMEPRGESKVHSDIFVELAKAMGAVLKRPKEAEIRNASKASEKKTFSPFVKQGGFDASPGELIEAINASVINSSRLLWLKEAAKSVEV